MKAFYQCLSISQFVYHTTIVWYWRRRNSKVPLTQFILQAPSSQNKTACSQFVITIWGHVVWYIVRSTAEVPAAFIFQAVCGLENWGLRVFRSDNCHTTSHQIPERSILNPQSGFFR